MAKSPNMIDVYVMLGQVVLHCAWLLLGLGPKINFI